MTSHELAKILLEGPDLPVATHANNHTYASDRKADGDSHGPLNVGRLNHYACDHIIIGNFWRRDINAPNAFITDIYKGELSLTRKDPFKVICRTCDSWFTWAKGLERTCLSCVKAAP